MINSDACKIELVLASGYQAPLYNNIALLLGRPWRMGTADQGGSADAVLGRAFLYSDVGNGDEERRVSSAVGRIDHADSDDAFSHVSPEVMSDHAVGTEVLLVLGGPLRKDRGRSKDQSHGVQSALRRNDRVACQERTRVAFGGKHYGRVNNSEELAFASPGHTRTTTREELVVTLK